MASMTEAVPPTACASHLPGLSVTELSTAIQQRLRHSGALRQLKTQLRGMVLTDILKNRRIVEGRSPPAMTLEEFERCRQGGLNVGNDSEMPLHSSNAGGEMSHPPPTTWPSRIADCLIHNHLYRSARQMSLSIFATEAEVPPLSDTGAPSDEEVFLCQLLGLPEGSGVEADDVSSRNVKASSARQSIKSALEMLVEEALARRGEGGDPEAHRHQCGTQTEDWNPPSDSTNPLTSMECRLAAVDAKYALAFSHTKQGGACATWRGEVERRMAQYKEDLHQLLRAEYQQKYRTFEQTSLHEARQQMEEHYRILHEHHKKELEEKERTVAVKSEQESERIRHIREDLEQQRQRLEKKQLDLISFQQEAEAEVEKLHSKLREQRDKAQTLRFQCEKWEELCGSRLMEAEAARAREMRRLEELRCAKADHAAEVHVLEEEIHQLRFRLRMIGQGGTVPQSATTAPVAGDAAAAMAAAAVAYTGGSNSTRSGVIPPYYATPQHQSARPGDEGDDIDSFIHRTDRSQKEEMKRQELSAMVRRGDVQNLTGSGSFGNVYPMASVVGSQHSMSSQLPSAGGTPYSAHPQGSSGSKLLERSPPPSENHSAAAAPGSHTPGGGPNSAMDSSLLLAKGNVSAAVPTTNSNSDPVTTTLSSSPAGPERPSEIAPTRHHSPTPTDRSPPQHPEGPQETARGTGSTPASSLSVSAGGGDIRPDGEIRPASFSSKLGGTSNMEEEPSNIAPVEASTISNGVATGPQSQVHPSRRSGNSSLLATAAKVLSARKNPDSSSKQRDGNGSTTTTTTTTSSSSSSASDAETEEERSKWEVQSQSALEAKIQRLTSSEAGERVTFDKEEEVEFKSIAWSHRTKLSVIQSQEQAKRDASGRSSKITGSSSGSSSGRGKLQAWRRDPGTSARQKDEDDVIIRRDSDADDDILYKSSSGSSF